jgi:hypothetical protein
MGRVYCGTCKRPRPTLDAARRCCGEGEEGAGGLVTDGGHVPAIDTSGPFISEDDTGPYLVCGAWNIDAETGIGQHCSGRQRPQGVSGGVELVRRWVCPDCGTATAQRVDGDSFTTPVEPGRPQPDGGDA